MSSAFDLPAGAARRSMCVRARWRWALVAPLLAAALVCLVGCTPEPPAAAPLRAVKVMEVGTSRFESAPEFSGEVRARVESRLGFRVAGKITRRPAELGQHVAAGAVLAQLDAQDYRLAADAARAQVTAAQTQRDLTAADLARYRELRAQNFISAAELERRDAAHRAAQAQLAQAHAQLAAEGNQARYTTLVADAAGVVTGVDAEVGQVVATGAPVVRIAQDGARDAVFSVPEDQATHMAPGSPVKVRGWLAERELDGTVREVAASADPVTRTYQVKVGIAAATAPPLGATVYVRPQALSRQGQPVLKVPTGALRQDGAGSAVWVLDAATMKVQSQPVQLGTVDGNEAVITAGLAPGQQIVTTGVHVLVPGQQVVLYHDPRVAAGSAAESAAPAAPTQPAPAAPGAR